MLCEAILIALFNPDYCFYWTSDTGCQILVSYNFILFRKELFKKLAWGNYFGNGKNREAFFFLITRGSAAASENKTCLKLCPLSTNGTCATSALGH